MTKLIGTDPSQVPTNGDLGDLAYQNKESVNIEGGNATLNNLTISPTGYFTLPSGTTAQRPGSPATGSTRYNTTTGSIEFYDGTNWIATNLIPSINSITGTIYAGLASTLTLSLTNVTNTIDVKYYEGGTLLATDSGVTVTSGSATSTVPSAVYGQTAGDTISIQVLNIDGSPSSNSVSKTVAGLPTGGTITTSGSYRIHTFTSSGTLSVPSGFSASADYLIVAGGGAGGADIGGGGGAGGLLSGSTTISQNSYSIVVGAGATGQQATNESGSTYGPNGSNTTALSLTAIGGGGGGAENDTTSKNGRSGGSGGGGGYSNGSAGSGTSGQGYAGGTSANESGGGGGAGGAGGNGGSGQGGHGGVGVQSSIDGTTYYYAGGGGGSGWTAATYAGNGGLGGGGGGGGVSNNQQNPGSGGGSARNSGTNGSGGNGGNGGANTGGGGGAAGEANNTYHFKAGNGGSGIVIIRYQL